jgi:predicted Zn-dependent peptidase
LPPPLHERLENGLEITMLRRGGVPLVALELVFPVGRADDGAKPGTALVCSELLRERTRTPVPELEVGLDQTRYSYSIASGEVADAMRALGELQAMPPASRPEFERVRQRWVQKTQALAERDGAWAARAYLYARLFRLPVGRHPYAAMEASVAELRTLTPADCTRHFSRALAPEGAVLVAVGDLEPSEVVRLAQVRLGHWRGSKLSRPTSPTPLPPARLEVALLDRPGRTDSVIVVGTLGPGRAAPDTPALRVALELMRGRTVTTTIDPQLDGPTLITLGAHASIEATALEVKALLDALGDLRTRERSDEETQAAVRALADGFWVRAETNRALARLFGSLGAARLDDETLDRERSSLRDVVARQVQEAAIRHLADSRLVVVVSGDAARLAAPLSRFGPVSVVDPSAGFVVRRSLAGDPTTPLELPREGPR